ncbi:TPA: hypothetical protein NIK58_000545 [Vibrio cholerae]|uniref:hypothetical protein n=1 Tax=Vibrio cholerae TaxID=666 RepID=UPI001267EDC6|nr:hypothetical protein [Vibrio cholerae]EMC8696578.1 hypothetical protein [Vibrio cholerae]HCF7740806.1 hypothetical protein [Vibrio cholerae]HCF7750136.1 hypothetical protein [Vibrio cholerae]HCF7767759.1 hypothetical protein [Vibrio cholerae]HCF7781915.1 hypothetical protein [Vibrio cholerae]
MHLLRRIFGKRKTVKRRHITQFSGSGNSAMIYDSSQREWVYLYLLNIDYGCGHVLPASSWDESELRKIALSNSNSTHYSDLELTRTEPTQSNATDSDHYRAREISDSSSSDSYDSCGSSCGSSSSFD